MSSQEKTAEAMYDAVITKIYEAVDGCAHPIQWRREWHFATCHECRRNVAKERRFRLSDALLTFQRAPMSTAYSIRFFYNGFLQFEKDGKLLAKWNLAHDDLAWHRDNAPETIAFLHSALCP